MASLTQEEKDNILEKYICLKQKNMGQPITLDSAREAWKVCLFCQCIFYEVVEGYQEYPEDCAQTLLSGIKFGFNPAPALVTHWFYSLCHVGSPLAYTFYQEYRKILSRQTLSFEYASNTTPRYQTGIIMSLAQGHIDVLDVFLRHMPHLCEDDAVHTVLSHTPMRYIHSAESIYEKWGRNCFPQIEDPRIAVKYIFKRDWGRPLTDTEVLNLLLMNTHICYDDPEFLFAAEDKSLTEHGSLATGKRIDFLEIGTKKEQPYDNA